MDGGHDAAGPLVSDGRAALDLDDVVLVAPCPLLLAPPRRGERRVIDVSPAAPGDEDGQHPAAHRPRLDRALLAPAILSRYL